MPHYVTVEDPKGEKFEVTVPNARDLVRHLGWRWVGVRKAEVVAEQVPTPSVPTAQVNPPILTNVPVEPTPAPNAPAVTPEPVMEVAPTPPEEPAPEPSSPTTRKRN